MSAAQAEQHPPHVAYLRSLPAIRQRCAQVYALAQEGKLDYFDLQESSIAGAVDDCAKIIERDFGHNFASIPPHGRWRHFDAAGLPRVTTMLSRWADATTPPPPVPPLEAARRLVDLFLVSVLLDAGAGTTWRYEEKATGMRIARSEGLAVASLEMFSEGLFAVEGEPNREQCQAGALAKLSPDLLSMALQVHPEENPMDGLEGRAGLLQRLGTVLAQDRHGYFAGPSGTEVERRRPGFLVDYLFTHPDKTVSPQTGKVQVPVRLLWELLIEGLSPIWPTDGGRTTLEGVHMGDVWRCEALERRAGKQGHEALVPFHKLTQWLCYSLLEPMEQTLGWEFVGGEDQTGLPEYRNGGLLIDTGVLVPKPALYAASLTPVSGETGIHHVEGGSGGGGVGVPRLAASHPAVVEWRACTVVLLDRIAEALRQRWGLSEAQLNLKQVLEAATWKGGREIAREKRPETRGGPPIAIESDGTVF